VLAVLLLLAAQPCRAAVLDLAPGEGITPERAASFTEVVTGEVGQHLGCSVLSRTEIRALVSFEVERQMSGCDATSCLSEIGEALGVERLVLGTISKIESRTLVSLRLVDMNGMTVLRRVTDSFEGKEKDAVKWVAWLARRLAMKNEADAGERPVVDTPMVVERRPTLWRTLALTGLGLSAASLVAAGALGGSALGVSATVESMKTTRGIDRRQVENLEGLGPWLAGGANLGLYLGAAFALAGGALFFAPGEEIAEVEQR
jgi:TolB-like protein